MISDGPASPIPDRAKEGDFMASGVTRRDVVRQLAQSGGLSILIKAANGVLAYVMLLAIARSTTTEQYGIFAVAFAIAMTVASIALLGQPMTVTRFWPQWMGQNEPLKARAVLRRSMIITALGLGVAVILMLLGGALDLIVEMPWSFSLAAATALFALAFGWAEFSSAGLRAQGFVVIALAPRDIAWRVAVCAIFGGAALAGRSFDAVAIMLAVAGILVVIVFPQIMMLLRSSMGATVEHLPTTDRRIISRYSVVLCAITSVNWLRDFAGIVIVSAYLGAETAGGYFVADRTANLLAFILLAVNLVLAPLISRYYHSGRKDIVRIIVGVTGLMAGFTALIGLIFFFFFGAKILALFNPLYATYLPVLLILGSGQFLTAATGPAGSLLNQSGHQRVNLILSASFGGVGIALQVFGGLYYGAIGVASAAAGAAVFANLLKVVYAWRTLGIDSTGLSLAVHPIRKLHKILLRNLRPPS